MSQNAQDLDGIICFFAVLGRSRTHREAAYQCERFQLFAKKMARHARELKVGYYTLVYYQR
jgi:hypothetical protein